MENADVNPNPEEEKHESDASEELEDKKNKEAAEALEKIKDEIQKIAKKDAELAKESQQIPGTELKLPTYSDYISKCRARLNALFDALYQKSEVEEVWTREVNPMGIKKLKDACRAYTIWDLTQVYGELAKSNIGMALVGADILYLKQMMDLQLHLADCIVKYHCYRDDDGMALKRFKESWLG
ncbi:MAG: hypothetical protein ACW963_07110 [Candidatus Sifarchaeia archaeon]|jgi:hypothetical protein